MSPLTPYDIHNKEFKRSFRGYDVDEVNDFLDQIIKDFEVLTREKLELEQQVEDLQAELERVVEGDSMYPGVEAQPQAHPQPQRQLQPQQQQTQTHMPPAQIPQQSNETMLQPSAASLSSMEQSIHKSIRVAQEVAEEVRINAKKEAELIVQEAEKNADRIINEALQKARAIHSELLDLKQKATIYRARFRTLVQSHLDVLENSDWESLEELESNLEETGQQLEQYSENPSPELLIGQQAQQEIHQLEDSSMNVNLPNLNMNMNMNVMDEVAPTFLEEDGEPRRELRRTSRKLKKKAMF